MKDFYSGLRFGGTLVIVLAILFWIGFTLWAVQKPRPTPIPTTTSTTTGAAMAFTWQDQNNVQFFFADAEKMLQVNRGNQHLIVRWDGRVEGDLPHDRAADQFWRSLAQSYPHICTIKKEKP